MKNLLTKLAISRKRNVRVSRNLRRDVLSAQIAKMGKMGQQLVIMSK